MQDAYRLEESGRHGVLKEVSNECLQQSIRNLDSAFTRFFREKKGFPKFKSKHKSRAVYKAINSVAVDLDNNRIKLLKSDG